MSLKDHIKNEDSYFESSKAKLSKNLTKHSKNIFIGILSLVEMLDISEEQFQRMRKKILDIGNDEVRDIQAELKNYNIEFIPQTNIFEYKKGDE